MARKTISWQALWGILHLCLEEWLKQNAPKLILADEPGLGKSAQVVVAAKELGLQRILVVAPASVCASWVDEFKTWGAYTTRHIHREEIPADGVIVMSYDMATRRVDELAPMVWDLVVLDEAHFLKSRTTKRTKAILGRII